MNFGPIFRRLRTLVQVHKLWKIGLFIVALNRLFFFGRLSSCTPCTETSCIRQSQFANDPLKIIHQYRCDEVCCNLTIRSDKWHFLCVKEIYIIIAVKRVWRSIQRSLADFQPSGVFATGMGRKREGKGKGEEGKEFRRNGRQREKYVIDFDLRKIAPSLEKWCLGCWDGRFYHYALVLSWRINVLVPNCFSCNFCGSFCHGRYYEGRSINKFQTAPFRQFLK